ASRYDARDAAVASLEALELVVGMDRDAVLLEELVEEAPGVGPEATFERDALLHDDRAPLADLRERSGDLAAYVGAPDHDDVLSVGEVLADREGVAERAQVVDPLELTALDVEAADIRAGREQQLAELDFVLVGEL